MSKAGRDNFGRFIRDDAIIQKQIIPPMLGALTILMDQVTDAEAKEAIAHFIVQATVANGVLDLGAQKGDDDES
jgi:hypothetical protein